MKRVAIPIMSMLLLTACNADMQNTPHPVIEQANQKFEDCHTRKFKTKTALVQCLNEGNQMLLPLDGADADLRLLMMAKGLELAEKFDRKALTQSEFTLQIAQFVSHIQAEKQRRMSIRLATVTQVMQAQNNAATSLSMANSVSRIATANERIADSMLYGR